MRMMFCAVLVAVALVPTVDRNVAVASAATQTTPSTAAEGSFQSGGLEMHYRAAGSGPAIVLLSGGPGFNVDYMIPSAEYLPAGYTRIFLEQRGTGRSQPARPTAETMTLALAVQDLEALRLHLRQERLLLLGHSW